MRFSVAVSTAVTLSVRGGVDRCNYIYIYIYIYNGFDCFEIAVSTASPTPLQVARMHCDGKCYGFASERSMIG